MPLPYLHLFIKYVLYILFGLAIFQPGYDVPYYIVTTLKWAGLMFLIEYFLTTFTQDTCMGRNMFRSYQEGMTSLSATPIDASTSMTTASTTPKPTTTVKVLSPSSSTPTQYPLQDPSLPHAKVQRKTDFVTLNETPSQASLYETICPSNSQNPILPTPILEQYSMVSPCAFRLPSSHLQLPAFLQSNKCEACPVIMGGSSSDLPWITLDQAKQLEQTSTITSTTTPTAAAQSK